MRLDLSPEQLMAMTKVANWYRYENSPLYRLFGYAGTGKTTLARYIVDTLGLADTTLYAAYTGKAVSVLRAKECEPASTIHSLIYLPRARARQQLQQLQRELDREKSRNRSHRNPARVAELRRQVREEQERLESPEWLLRTRDETRLTGASLLVLDEVSMVDTRMADDLMSYGVRAVCLGDPAQLPPVAGEGGALTDTEADTLLTQVHRSALDSPVTRIATTIRGASGERGYGVTGLDGTSGRVRDLPLSELASMDQVLCGTNATRWQAIRAIRFARGLLGNSRNAPALRMPVPGDRIIILANSGQLDVYNGQQFDVWSVTRDGRDRLTLTVSGNNNDGSPRELPVWRWGFQGQDGESRARLSGRGDVAAATFSWATTTHKAQGSQWDRVAVIDESDVFARMNGGLAADRYRAGQRWLYTGVTRAAKQVILTGTGVVRDF